MCKRKIFTVNLYDYLSLDKAKVCKDYQSHNKDVIDMYNNMIASDDDDKWDYVLIDIDDELNEFCKDSSLSLFESMPMKYRYQMISDLVRYKYMMENPDSIYIDTDLCIFGHLGMEVLNAMSKSARKSETDLLAGEMNKNRLFPCNWLMIGSDRPDNIFIDMYNLLKDRVLLSNYEEYEFTKGKWDNKMESYIWEKLWGYAIPRELMTSKFSLIPYEYFQGCEWNKDWRDDSIMKKFRLVGCHFFGFGEGGRPNWTEFVEYHNLV